MDVCGIYTANAMTKTKGQTLDNIASGPYQSGPALQRELQQSAMQNGGDGSDMHVPPVCSLCDFGCGSLRGCAFHERIEEVRVEDCIIVAPVDQAAHVPIER